MTEASLHRTPSAVTVKVETMRPATARMNEVSSHQTPSAATVRVETTRLVTVHTTGVSLRQTPSVATAEAKHTRHVTVRTDDSVALLSTTPCGEKHRFTLKNLTLATFGN